VVCPLILTVEYLLGQGTPKERGEYIKDIEWLLTPDAKDQLFPKLDKEQKKMYSEILKLHNIKKALDSKAYSHSPQKGIIGNDLREVKK